MASQMEDFLFEVLAEELHMDVQDGSIAEVSEMTCRMFKVFSSPNQGIGN